MALSSTKGFSFLLLVMYITDAASSVPSSSSGGLEFLKVSPSQFVASLKSLSGVLQDVTSTLLLSKNNDAFQDFRLSNTISVCLHLLDSSVEELTQFVSAIENKNTLRGKHNSMGSLRSDLRMCLNSTLANTDTCMNEFEGTNGNIKLLISTRIGEVNVLVHDLLAKMHTTSDHLTSQRHFPSWGQKLPQENGVQVDAVVAADGSGNYTKVMDAVLAAPNCSVTRYVIYIKMGVYNEKVVIDYNKWNLMIIGDGMDATIISGNLSCGNGNLNTYQTPTFEVDGKGFIAQDISFRNTAGPENYQAVALMVNSDQSVFYRCGIFGYQDSLGANSNRQFYRECKISGSVDFIFGYAAAVFQSCQILIKKGLAEQNNTITAQGGGTDQTLPFGFVFQFCNISADSDLLPLVGSTPSFLGRPWKPYSTTVFMQSYISEVISPEGWLEWNGSEYLDTLYFAEYANIGPGAALQNRVKWSNYHAINKADLFTVANFISGNQWLPSTGVPFDSGLIDQYTNASREANSMNNFHKLFYFMSAISHFWKQ